MAEKERKMWTEFSQDASMHGLRYVFDKTSHGIRRSIWLLLILGLLVYLVFACSSVVDSFAAKHLSTTVKVKVADKLQLPTITICNQNTLKKSAVKALLGGYGAAFEELYMSLMLDSMSSHPVPEDKYDWSDPLTSSMNFRDTREQILVFAIQLGYTLEDLFIRCEYKAQQRNCSDLFIAVTGSQGNCFRFNSDGTEYSETAGVMGGLTVELDTKLDDYYPGPTSNSPGFGISFHEHFEPTTLNKIGNAVSPGTHALVDLEKKEYDRIPPPADGGEADCFDSVNLPNPLLFYSNYSHSGCMTECFVLYLESKCQCTEANLPDLKTGAHICTMHERIYCMKKHYLDFWTAEDGKRSCGCELACKQSEYIPKITTYKYPSPQVLNLTGHSSEEIRYQEENHVVIDIYYGKMTYEIIIEAPTYDLYTVIANVGGTMGLCVGASLLSLCEFIDFLIVAIAYKLNTRKKIGATVENLKY